ncbi:hypothetical protein TNCV_2596921 [Trichonephila clavipes]|nr:hypothetical protein TNCV_2596921 [Trichonephila clavipes]
MTLPDYYIVKLIGVRGLYAKQSQNHFFYVGGTNPHLESPSGLVKLDQIHEPIYLYSREEQPPLKKTLDISECAEEKTE